MRERSRNRFAYVTLLDLGFDPADPEILLELGMERPVDWDAADADGVICRRLDFVLTVDHVRIGGEPIGIHCVYERVVKDHGLHGGLYVYVIGLRPTRGNDGRESDRVALLTAVDESVRIRRRSWCADIGEIRIAWRHAPQDVCALDNGSFVPETHGGGLPPATEDEIQRAFDGLDAFCAAVDLAEPTDPDGAADPASMPYIPLDESDIEEFDLDLSVIGPLETRAAI